MDDKQARAWLAGLPGSLAAQRQIMSVLLDVCLGTPAARMFLVGCSIGRGAADELSDVDCFVRCQAGSAGDVAAAVHPALPAMGPLVDALEHDYAGRTRIVAQFAGCAQLDLVIGQARPRASSDHVVLYDADGDAVDGQPVSSDVVTAQQVREWAFLAWMALADVAKYLRRGSAWEALARLGEVRDRIWALWAAARGAHQPAYGLTQVLDRDPGDLPAGIEATVAGLDLASLHATALAAAAVLQQVSSLAAQAFGATLPGALARHVTGLLQPA